MDLWVKAGSDGVRLGGDPVSHQLFMILILKSAEDSDSDRSLKFNVRTVNDAKPPEEFKQAGLRHAPALQHTSVDVCIQHPDEIIEYVDKMYPYPSLKYHNDEADCATADLFRMFCFYIKEVNKDPKVLETELRRVDKYLLDNEDNGGYLTGPSPSHLDCRILPKLHSIRVACRELKDYRIPTELTHLWAYLARGYELPAFRKSCPADQEIVLYWADRPDTPNISSQRRATLYRQKTQQSLTVPDIVTDCGH